MSDKPDLVYNEPIATGWLRTELYGDVEQARDLLPYARRLLGNMRTFQGVNERIANGEPGGFYRNGLSLPSGARIEVLTNDGHDTVRIGVRDVEQFTPPAVQEAPRSTGWDVDAVHTESNFEGEHHEAGFTPDEPEPPPYAYGEDEEPNPEEPPVADYMPYLWIGVRIVTGDKDKNDPTEWENRLHVCVWEEPEQVGPPPVILSNRNQFEPLDPENGHDASEYPLQYWTQFTPPGMTDTGPKGPTAIGYTDQHLLMILPRNVQGVPMRVPDYDPAVDEDVEWDIMFISDPENDLNLFAGNVSLDGTRAGGTYYVKIMASGPDCEKKSEVHPCEIELKMMVGKDEQRLTDTKRITIEEFTEYRMGIMPKGWYVPHDAPDSSDPCDTCDIPAPDFGANPHGPHWWQGMGTAIVAPFQYQMDPEAMARSSLHFSPDGAVELPYYPLNPDVPAPYEPAGFPTRADRCPACTVTSTLYGTLGYTAPPVATIDLDEGPYWPSCPPDYKNIVHYTAKSYPIFPSDPIYAHFKAGDVGGAAFSASTGTKYVPFVEGTFVRSDFYPESLYGPYWEHHTESSVMFVTGGSNCGFLMCCGAQATSVGLLYFTAYEQYQRAHMDPVETYNATLRAYYKIIRSTDKNGELISDEVTFIDEGEYMAALTKWGPDNAGHPIFYSCGHTEKD